MNTEFKAVPLVPLKCCIPYDTPPVDVGSSAEDDPAYTVMTDFQKTAPITIEPLVSIDAALRKMIDAGVRLLLVTDDRGDIEGVITSYDIQGEEPVRRAAAAGIAHADITVGMIMTPLERMPAFDFDFVQRLLIRHVVETMRHLNRQHALVVEYKVRKRGLMVRGLFSTSHIGRALGRPVHAPMHAADSLAEMQLTLHRS